jgi:hypothetical protein
LPPYRQALTLPDTTPRFVRQTLVLLCLVVQQPTLNVRRSLRDGIHHDLRVGSAVVAGADHVGRDEVLTQLLPEGEVFARTRKRFQRDAVFWAGAGLRGHEPGTVREGDLASGRDFQAFSSRRFMLRPSSIATDVWTSCSHYITMIRGQ